MPNPDTVLSGRATLITLISFILLIGFAATNLISYEVSRRSMRQALIGNELPLTSDNIYSEIQRDLLQPIFVSSLMASDTFVRDWLLEGEKDPSKMVRFLEGIRNKYGVFTSFMISEKTRNYYHFSGISQVVSEDDPADAWYFRVRQMKKEYEINVDLNAEQNNALTVFVNHKVLDYNKNYIGATGVGLKFDTMKEILSRYKQNYGRHIYFINEDGKVMVRSQGSVITEIDFTQAKGVSAIADNLLKTPNGFFEYERDGEVMLVSSRKIPELNWWLIVEQRESDSLAGIKKSLITNLFVGFVVIALTLMVVIYTIRVFHHRLEKLATTDKLTGLGNRSVFDLSLQQALNQRKRDQLPLSVILMDIDHFKSVNDSLGHVEGDRVIRDVAELIGGRVREVDIVCRWGGEEFVILARNCGLKNAALLGENIREALENTAIVTLPNGKRLSISAGVAEAQETDSIDSLINRADQALYQAKQQGRNQVCSG